jgi:hypothetical protein
MPVGPQKLVRFAECWLGSWLGPTTFDASSGSLVLAPRGAGPAQTMAGTVFGGFTDSHVHLGLIDGTTLPGAGIAAVDDLGWIPDVARDWSRIPGMPAIRFAGAFLTAPGGYPSDRSWAPGGSVVEIGSPQQAVDAVAAQRGAGASFVKIALNSVAGPVLDDDTLRAIVTAAHARGVTAVAHAEGPGQTRRAFDAGVDRLAHAPFSEALPDSLLSAMAGRMSWVSTLDIHRGGSNAEAAMDNVRRFALLGGDVRYGTDLGNGALPVGINPRELGALAECAVDLVRAITPEPSSDFGPRFSYAPGLPTDRDDLAAWLATSFVLGTSDLEETLS